MEVINKIVKVFLVFLLFPLNATLRSQTNFKVPVNLPKAFYTMNIKIDIVNDQITGSGEIRFTNSGKFNLEEIAFTWPQTSRYYLEVRQQKELLICLNTRRTSTEPAVYRLAKFIANDQVAILKIKFSINGFSGSDQDRIYLKNCFPKIWWDGLPSPDNYAVKINAPDNYLIAATGRLDKSGRYIGENIRNFAFYLGKNQKKYEQEVEGVLLSVIYPQSGERVGKTAFKMLQQAIPFYKKWFGFFPFSYLNVIPGSKRGPWGGYNFATGMAVIHGMEHWEKKNPEFWKWITIHELCHHYWGECVYDGENPPWLWIGLGIYSDQHYLRHIKMDYNIYTGFKEDYFYRGVKKHLDTTLDIPLEHYEKLDFDWNNIVKHGKGFTVISALESTLGTEKVLNVLNRCMAEYRWKTLDINGFKKVVVEVSGQNMSWFFDQWIKSNKYLNFTVQDSSCVPDKNGFLTTITLAHGGSIRMDMPVKAYFTDGSSQTIFTSRLLRNPVVIFHSSAKLMKIELDPHHLLPPFQDIVQPTKDELLNLIDQLPWNDVGDEAIRPYELAKSMQIDTADPWFSLGLRLYESGDLTKSNDCFRQTAGYAEADNDTSLFMQSLNWQGMIADEQGQRSTAIEFYKRALALKYEIGVSHSQFNLVITNEWIKERLKKPYNGFMKVDNAGR